MAYNLEEQESIDNLKGWWEKWGTPVLVVITLACVGVAGYNGWKWWNHRQTAKASVAYVALETAVNNQEHQVDFRRPDRSVRLHGLRSDGGFRCRPLCGR